MGLTGVVFFKNLPVQQAFFRKRSGKGITAALALKFLGGVLGLGVLLQIIHHGVAHGVGEGGLFPVEDVVGQPVALKGVAQQVLAFSVGVELFGRVNSHNIFDKIQITEGNTGLHGVDADAPVRPKHIVHVQFGDPLLGFFLERLRRRGEVRVLVAEQLIGDLTGQQHPHVGPFVDGLTAEIHTQAGPDGGDVVGTQQGNDCFQCIEYFLPRHGNLHVLAADVVGHLAGVFQVNGVGVHADGEGPQGLIGELGGDGTD